MMLKPWRWCPVNLGVGEAYRYSFAEAENLFHADGLAFRVAPASQSRTLGVTLLVIVVGILVCLGYNVLYFDLTLPNGSVGQILDVLDYISNYVLMPVVAIATCVLVGWVLGPKSIIDEVTRNGERFGREKLYVAMVKAVAPVLLLLLLLQSLGVVKL